MAARSRNVTASAPTRRAGRKKLYTEQVRVTLPAGTLARLDAVQGDDEDRLDVIRTAIEREIKRRGQEA